MYSTCIYCDRSLGGNQVIEAFPVGRGLAFDPGKGRLWVVCRSCRRWNLSPLEERWEAVEQCERTFRELRTRVHSEEIGSAVHPEGLRLVRIGEPIPVEFAICRYGEAFSRRARKYAFYAGVTVVAGGVVAIAGAASGGAAGLVFVQAPNLIQTVDRLLTRVTVPLPGGEVVKVKPHKVDLLNPDGDHQFGLRVKHKGGETRLYDSDARRAASKVFPVINRFGARRETVQAAVEQMTDVGGTEAFLRETWGKARPKPGSSIRWVMSRDMKGGGMMSVPPTTFVGWEIALQEEKERRALEGELTEFKAAWREAEAIAKISDDLLIPSKIEERLDAMKEERDSE